MAGDVRVGHKLDLYAPHTRMGKNAVVQGRLHEAMVHFKDDFFEFTDQKFWTANVGNGGNVPATIAGANGLINLITNAAQYDVTQIGGTRAMWFAQQGGLTIEARFKATLVTSVALVFGLTNAVTSTNDKLIFNLDADGVATATTAADAACFVFDTTMTNAVWRMVSVKAGGTAQAASVASAAAPANATFEVFRITLDTSGNATFYRNGLVEGYIASALAAANSLIPYFGVEANAGSAARSVTPDYVEIWMNRPETSSVLW